MLAVSVYQTVVSESLQVCNRDEISDVPLISHVVRFCDQINKQLKRVVIAAVGFHIKVPQKY